MSNLPDNLEKMNIKDQDTMTNLFGRPMADKTNSVTVGPRGPMVLHDVQYLEELAHFDRERIPERVVHAKGAGAYGYLTITKPDMAKYCKAKMFSAVGKKTPLAVRFSTVGGESGSADSVRDPRGFAIKMYTEEGNWDLVGNNTPIFFIRDPVLFPSFIHTQKRNPRTHLKDNNAHWDFFSFRPEMTHQISFLFSDRGIPDGFRHMNGYGSHTFKLVNDKGEAFYTKFHFKTQQGIKNLDVETATKLAGENPDYAVEDLHNAIENKNFPKWTLFVQIMTYDQAAKWRFNPFDLTKVWPHSEFPLIEVGEMVLDRNPINYFAEIEQMALCPANMIPGIEPSPDRMLQGRLFSYADAQRYRLGVNYHHIPVNRAHCPIMAPTQRDGAACLDGNCGSLPNYYPNSQTLIKKENFVKAHVDTVSGDVDRFDFSPDDCFEQVTEFWLKVLNDQERERLVVNIAEHMAKASKEVQTRAVVNFDKVHPDFGDRIRAKLILVKTTNNVEHKPGLMAADLGETKTTTTTTSSTKTKATTLLHNILFSKPSLCSSITCTNYYDQLRHSKL